MRTDTHTAVASTIPVVDFGGMEIPERRTATVTALRQALETYGFCYLLNHGVPAAVVDEMFAQSRAFFSLPTEEKARVRPANPRDTRGYGGVATQALEEGRPGDLKEVFQAATETAENSGNVWPPQLPAFRPAVMAFHEAGHQACMRLMAAIALSLGLPEDYFAPYYDRNDSTARLLHYPPVLEEPAPGQIRAGAHTDFGGLNILFQDDQGGLEIQLPDGSWIPAPALPGTGILNTGDLIERWTNGQLRSSPHRVVNPEGTRAARDRFSAVLFHIPNRDATISCLEPCQDASRPPRYPPVTAGEHIRQRVESSRRHNPSY